MTEEQFQGGVNVVRRRGDAVHRPASPATPTIHRLLRHVRQAGFAGAPEPLGFDDQGNEVLTYLSGAVHPALPSSLRTPDLLAQAAVSLRGLHDASATFVRQAADRWHMPTRAPAEVICHGDVAPYNTVIRDGVMVGFIDFDTAHPGPRIWDLAYAVYRFAPLHAPSNPDCAGDPAEQARLAGHFCRAYGVEPDGDLLDVAVERLVALVDHIYAQAAAGEVAFRGHIAAGHPALYRDDIRYLQAERDTFLRAFSLLSRS